MKIIYIDANIYLGFYNSNRPDFKKLLGSVIELKDRIFFTEQIAHEIDRNKLNIFRQSIENYTRQVALSATTLPEHMEEDSSPKLSEWNKERKKLEDQISESNKSLLPILNDVLTEISVSRDKVSKELAAIYSKASVPSTIEIEKARLRRELGNPPGKRSDPLGDQLSWEQLLSVIKNVSHLWMVSTDRDYFTEHHKAIYLNPILYNDIIRLNPKIEIKTYNTLTEALRDYNKKDQIKAIPTNEELDVISENERQDLKGTSGLTTTYINNMDFIIPGPTICPKCNAIKSFTDGAYLRSQYGGLTLQYICKRCGFHYDTGEFFD